METILTNYEGELKVTLVRYKKGEIPTVKTGLVVLRIARGTGEIAVWITDPKESGVLYDRVQELNAFLVDQAEEAP